MFKKIRNMMKKSPKTNTTEKQYSKFGIGARLISAFSIVTILTIVISVISWMAFGTLTDAQNKTADTEVPSITKALKLANDTALITALAPQLGTAQSNEERQKRIDTLALSIQTAKDRLKELNSLVPDAPALANIAASLQELEPLIVGLDDSVKERLRLTDLRRERLKQLATLRETLKKGAWPLLIPLRRKLFDNNDTLEELMENTVKTALTGSEPEYSIDKYFDTNRDLIAMQENVLNVQSSGYLLISLLAEGALADDIQGVAKLSGDFLANISSMATPISKISQIGNTKASAPLEELFETLLVIGAKGTSDELIFKIRTNELTTIATTRQFLSESRLSAEQLSDEVNGFVSNIEESMQVVNAENTVLAEQSKMALAIVAIAAVLIAIGIGWLYIARNIVMRLMMMVESAQKLSEGDLDSSIYREGKDEIARLGHAIVGFRDTARSAKLASEAEEERRKTREAEKEQQTRENIENNRKAQEEKEQFAEDAENTKRAEMGRLADEFEGSVKHLVERFSNATTEMTSISTSMTNSAGETLSLSQTVASASEISSNSINSVAAATEELSASINEISLQAGQAATIAGEAVSEAERSNKMITRLNDAAAKIGDVVDLISDIAGQTNLLALNATIEAARAGDAGKGFAVVASEVKNLATQTAKATEEITTQIKSVQNETSQAVTAIGGISETIGRINSIATTISNSVEEQGTATNEISRNVQQAADSALQVSNNITSVNQNADLTGNSASEVQTVAGKLASEASALDKEVDRFILQVRAG
ncbi:MAG: methyl-accepting chemotaxis protein [Pseudomonas marincola]